MGPAADGHATPAVAVRLLGPFTITRGDEPVDIGSPRAASILTLLITRAPRPVSTDDLIHLLWDEPVPASALNTVQRYIGILRRALEPALLPREAGSFIHRRGGGYAWRETADQGTSDLRAFRVGVVRASAHAQDGDAALACEEYVRALQLWKGAVGEGLTLSHEGASVLAAVDQEFLDACVPAARAAVAAGRAERILPAVELATTLAPLHEPLHAARIGLLDAAGRQAEAVAHFHAVARRLLAELGVSPGPTLNEALTRVLTSSERPPPTVMHRTQRADPAILQVVENALAVSAIRATLADAAVGRRAILLLEGEPGAGKSMLLEVAAETAQAHAIRHLTGRCVEGPGAPAMHPWLQVVAGLSAPRSRPPQAEAGDHSDDLDSFLRPPPAAFTLPDVGSRFRLFEAVTTLIGRVAEREGLVLLLDDLQWADAASLEMLAYVSDNLPPGTAIVATFRDRAPKPDEALVSVLARMSRRDVHRRVRLMRLTADGTLSLVRGETGREPSPTIAELVHRRTGGNPFLVRELARLLGDRVAEQGCDSVETELPGSVVDIVRHRTASLSDQTRRILEVSALMGRRVDVGLLVDVVHSDARECLRALDRLAAEGILLPSEHEPRSYEFAHDLFRDAILRMTPAEGSAEAHLAIANALAKTDDVEAVADHLWNAGPLADSGATARALIRAADIASSRSSFETAEARLQAAVRLARVNDLPADELAALGRLTAIVGMRAGYVAAAVDLLERAESLARALGRERAAADFLFSRWAAFSQGIELDRAHPLAARLLSEGRGSSDPIVSAYGWHAWGFHQWDRGEIEDAFAHLARGHELAFQVGDDPDTEPLRRDLRLLWPVMFALVTGLHGDLDTSHDLFDRSEASAAGDPYAITVWSAFSVMTAALAGDVDWAERAARRGIAADPDGSFTFLGSYQRLGLLWARAISGRAAADAVSDAEAIIERVFVRPPRSGLSTWYCLLSEMMIAAGQLDHAGGALDRAERAMRQHDQRYAEPLMGLVRARLAAERGADPHRVTAMIAHARELARARGAYLYLDRTDRLPSRSTTSGTPRAPQGQR